MLFRYLTDDFLRVPCTTYGGLLCLDSDNDAACENYELLYHVRNAGNTLRGYDAAMLVMNGFFI